MGGEPQRKRAPEEVIRGLSKAVTLELRWGGGRIAKIRRNSLAGKENSRCKGPVAGTLVLLEQL